MKKKCLLDRAGVTRTRTAPKGRARGSRARADAHLLAVDVAVQHRLDALLRERQRRHVHRERLVERDLRLGGVVELFPFRARGQGGLRSRHAEDRDRRGGRDRREDAGARGERATRDGAEDAHLVLGVDVARVSRVFSAAVPGRARGRDKHAAERKNFTSNGDDVAKSARLALPPPRELGVSVRPPLPAPQRAEGRCTGSIGASFLFVGL